MKKKVFQANLSVESVNELKNQLRDYKYSFLQRKLEELTRELSERGVEIAKANVTKLDAIFTGELRDSLDARQEEYRYGRVIYIIVTDSEHAAFVEFGTGQLGMERSYLHQFPTGVKWDYNTGSKIFEFAPGNYGWFYERDGQWYFTQGMPSRPFMYETAMELFQEIPKISKEIFGRRV